MLAKRYIYDGKELVHLNSVQRMAKEQLLTKIDGGVYKSFGRKCDCGADSSEMDLLAQKDRYGLPVNTVICKKCGMIMTNPMLDQGSLNQFYDTEYRPLYVMAKDDDTFFEDEYKKGIEIHEFIKEYNGFDQIKNVLEIGSGMGGIIKAIEDKENVSVLGIDLGNDYIQKGQQRGVNLIQANAEQICEKHPHEYDLIILCHVLEHFLDIESELKVIEKLLSPNGCLYIEVPGVKDIGNSFRDFLCYLQSAHVRYFTLDTLKQIMRWNGFSMIEGNEKIQSLYIYTGINDKMIIDYYEDNKEYLKKLEKNNFFLINVRYPLAKMKVLRNLYHSMIKHD